MQQSKWHITPFTLAKYQPLPISWSILCQYKCKLVPFHRNHTTARSKDAEKKHRLIWAQWANTGITDAAGYCWGAFLMENTPSVPFKYKIVPETRKKKR